MEMNHGDTIRIDFGNGDFLTTPAIYQYDHGLTLHVSGITLTEIQQAHATSDAMKTAFLLTPTNSGDGIDVPLPDLLSIHDKDIYVYLYTEQNNKGFTQRSIRIPVVPRNAPDTIELDNPYFYEANRIAHQVEALAQRAEAAEEAAAQAASDAEDAAEAAAAAVADFEPLTNDEIDTIL